MLYYLNILNGIVRPCVYVLFVKSTILISVEAQRDFHMTKIKNLVKTSSRHTYMNPAVYEKTTAIAIKPFSPAQSPQHTVTDVPTITTTIKVLVAGKKFQSNTATAVTTQKVTTTRSTTVAELSTVTSTTTTTTAIAPASQMPISEYMPTDYLTISFRGNLSQFEKGSSFLRCLKRTKIYQIIF